VVVGARPVGFRGSHDASRVMAVHAGPSRRVAAVGEILSSERAYLAHVLTLLDLYVLPLASAGVRESMVATGMCSTPAEAAALESGPRPRRISTLPPPPPPPPRRPSTQDASATEGAVATSAMSRSGGARNLLSDAPVSGGAVGVETPFARSLVGGGGAGVLTASGDGGRPASARLTIGSGSGGGMSLWASRSVSGGGTRSSDSGGAAGHGADGASVAGAGASTLLTPLEHDTLFAGIGNLAPLHRALLVSVVCDVCATAASVFLQSARHGRRARGHTV